MTKVFIDGGVGTTGLEIRERLADHREIELIVLPEDQRKDRSARADALNGADIVILCLPDDAAREAVALIENSRTRVIDASTAHRVAAGWTYGFPEVVGRDTVCTASRVSNPGCYATGFIALIAPLVRSGLIPPDWPLSCNAVSGYSGGGKSMIAEFEGGTAPTAWRAYALGLGHKHVPEMRAHCDLSVAPIFMPSVANTVRGMVVEVPLPLAAMPGHPTPTVIYEALCDFYAGSQVVSIIPDHKAPTLEIELLANTDRLDLFVFGNDPTGQVRLAAVLDNLGKGAAGAAVQNLNLIAGLPETEGLRL